MFPQHAVSFNRRKHAPASAGIPPIVEHDTELTLGTVAAQINQSGGADNWTNLNNTLTKSDAGVASTTIKDLNLSYTASHNTYGFNLPPSGEVNNTKITGFHGQVRVNSDAEFKHFFTVVLDGVILGTWQAHASSPVGFTTLTWDTADDMMGAAGITVAQVNSAGFGFGYYTERVSGSGEVTTEIAWLEGGVRYTTGGEYIPPPPPEPDITLHSAVTDRNNAYINLPADIQDGDIGVFIDWTWENIAEVIPTGWTAQTNLFGANYTRQIVSTKLLTAAEAGTAVTGGAVTDRSAKHLLVFRSGAPVSGITIPAASKVSVNDGSTPQSHSIGVYTEPYFTIAAVGDTGGGSTFSAYSPTHDGESLSPHTSGGGAVRWNFFKDTGLQVDFTGSVEFNDLIAQGFAIEVQNT